MPVDSGRAPLVRGRRILLYTHSLGGGGAERVWAVLASGLAERGHDVHLVTDFAADANASRLDPRVRATVLGGGHAGTIRRLADILSAERPDIALSAIAGANLKLVAARALARARMPLVISWHGETEGRSGWLGWLGCVLLPLLSRRAARTVAVSDGLRATLVQRWRAVASRTVRIYNPVDVPPVSPLAPDALAARDEIVLAVGRLVADKDVALIVRAMAGLGRPATRLVVLGDGPDRPAIEAEARRHGLADRVEIAGYVAEPWRHYAEARCLALASRHEAFGNVVVEALAHGLSVVATDCEGPREILDGGRYGTLIPVGDETAMTRALAAALEQPGDPAPRQARAATFSRDAGVDAWERLIDEVVAAASGS